MARTSTTDLHVRQNRGQNDPDELTKSKDEIRRHCRQQIRVRRLHRKLYGKEVSQQVDNQHSQNKPTSNTIARIGKLTNPNNPAQRRILQYISGRSDNVSPTKANVVRIRSQRNAETHPPVRSTTFAMGRATQPQAMIVTVTKPTWVEL